MFRNFLQSFLATLISSVYFLYSLTWRVKVQYRDRPNQPILYAHYHGQLITLLKIFAFRSIIIMSSRNKDGRLMAKIADFFGYKSVAGSRSYAGSEALLELSRSITEKKLTAAMAIDGSTGPIHRVKPGIILLAKITGLPIIPVICKIDRYWTIKTTWDLTQIPKPLAQIEIFYGDPIYVGASVPKEELESYRIALEDQLMSLYLQHVPN